MLLRRIWIRWLTKWKPPLQTPSAERVAGSTSSVPIPLPRPSLATYACSTSSHEHRCPRRLLDRAQAPRAVARRGEGVRPRHALPAAGGADALPRRGDLRRIPPAVAGGRHGDGPRAAQHAGRAVLLPAALRRAHQAAVRAPDHAVPRGLGTAVLGGAEPVERAAAAGGAPPRGARLAGAGLHGAVGDDDHARLPADHRRAHPLA